MDSPDPFLGTRLVYCDILGEPERFFAWLPVRCFDGKWVWLRPAWRRLCIKKPHLSGPDDPWWQYARTRRPTPSREDKE